MHSIAFVSNLVTATLLLLVVWFLYKYSSLFPDIERHWILIYMGVLALAVGNFVRALTYGGLGDVYSLFISVVGSLLLLIGFYRLYVAYKV